MNSLPLEAALAVATAGTAAATGATGAAGTEECWVEAATESPTKKSVKQLCVYITSMLFIHSFPDINLTRRRWQ